MARISQIINARGAHVRSEAVVESAQAYIQLSKEERNVQLQKAIHFAINDTRKALAFRSDRTTVWERHIACFIGELSLADAGGRK